MLLCSIMTNLFHVSSAKRPVTHRFSQSGRKSSYNCSPFSKPDSDGSAEDRLDNGGIESDQRLLKQVKLPELLGSITSRGGQLNV